MEVDANGRLWLTNSDYGAGSSPDCIYWVEDVNADGDAFDAGESQIYYFTPTGGAVGDSAPSSLSWGQDGRLYYVENGHSGFQPKGIYALDDLNSDGFIDPLTEASAFYLPPSHPAPGVFYVLAEDDDGHWLLPDLISRQLWRLKDGNGDDVITHEWEAEIVWAPAQSQVWGIDGAGDGAYYIAESANPDRVLRLQDADFDGLFDSGEVSAIYADNVSDTLIAAPRAIAVGDIYLPGTVVCDGGTARRVSVLEPSGDRRGLPELDDLGCRARGLRSALRRRRRLRLARARLGPRISRASSCRAWWARPSRSATGCSA